MTWKLLGLVVGLTAALPLHAESARPTPRPRVVPDPRASRGPFINRERYERIQSGMRQAQVEALLGGPPGNYTTRRLWFPAGFAPFGFCPHRREYWFGNDGRIQVQFNEQGLVTGKTFVTGAPQPPP